MPFDEHKDERDEGGGGPHDPDFVIHMGKTMAQMLQIAARAEGKCVDCTMRGAVGVALSANLAAAACEEIFDKGRDKEEALAEVSAYLTERFNDVVMDMVGTFVRSMEREKGRKH